MEKPREFWIISGKIYTNAEDARYIENALATKAIHVIEKAAYDELASQLENSPTTASRWREKYYDKVNELNDAEAKLKIAVEKLKRIDTHGYFREGYIAEILRQINADNVQSQCKSSEWDAGYAEAKREMEKENERLRSALKNVKSHIEFIMGPNAIKFSVAHSICENVLSSDYKMKEGDT